MSNHQILVEEPALNIDTLEVKNSDDKDKTDNKVMNIPKNANEINLIFRNQLSKDTILLLDKTKIKTVGDIINLLLEKLQISSEDKYIRLFFKGRPLHNDELIEKFSK